MKKALRYAISALPKPSIRLWSFWLVVAFYPSSGGDSYSLLGAKAQAQEIEAGDDLDEEDFDDEEEGDFDDEDFDEEGFDEEEHEDFEDDEFDDHDEDEDEDEEDLEEDEEEEDGEHDEDEDEDSDEEEGDESEEAFADADFDGPDFDDHDFDDPEFEPGEFGDNDYDAEYDGIVAINLTPAQESKTKALGFRVRNKASLKQLKLEVTNLLPPKGLADAEAILQLRKAVPKGYFEGNSIYRLAKGKACSGIKCYANTLIGWDKQWIQRGSQCGKNIRLGMIDSGVNTRHPALRKQNIKVQSFVVEKNTNRQHGTAIASLLVGDRKSEFPGLMPSAELFAVNIFDTDKQGRLKATAERMVMAIDWLIEKNISIINVSIAGPANDTLHTAIKRAETKGTVIIAAAGNGGPSAPPAYPAAYPSVIAVTALDRHMRSYGAANRGEYLTVAAPGVGIWVPEGKGGRFDDGTSYASVYATAVSALMIYGNTIYSGTISGETISDDTGKQNNMPRLNARVLQTQLRNSVDDLGSPGKDEIFGWGLVRSKLKCSGV